MSHQRSSAPVPSVTILTRRRFLRQTSASALALGTLGLTAATDAASKTRIPILGVCRAPDQADRIAQAGYDYIEAGVRNLLLPGKPEADFERELARIRKSGITARACSGFYPGDMKLVGPAPRTAAALRHGEVAFERANKAGVKIIVLGSGGARRIPDGFDPIEARKQFVAFCQQLGPLAQAHGVTVGLEPLNRDETNFLNSVADGANLVDEVGHPSIRLVADIYHMLREAESPESIRRAGQRVCHCHVAEREQRTPPGTAGDVFTPYFTALKRVSYAGSISVECRWPKDVDLVPVMRKARQVVTEQWTAA